MRQELGQLPPRSLHLLPLLLLHIAYLDTRERPKAEGKWQ
jgi:hypothetical protein